MLKSVIPNSDLARAANLLMDLYGASASTFASMRSKRLLDEDNLASAMIWLRVFATIEGQTRDRQDGHFPRG
jgi:hypothetical protein